MSKQTPGQGALLSLVILLDTLDLDHPDIVEDWVAKIAAELATPDLLTALEDITDFVAGNGQWAERHMYIEQARAAIAKQRSATQDATARGLTKGEEP